MGIEVGIIISVADTIYSALSQDIPSDQRKSKVNMWEIIIRHAVYVE
jgi:hypothetical protein